MRTSKVIAILLIAVGSLTACGGSDSSTAPNENTYVHRTSVSGKEVRLYPVAEMFPEAPLEGVEVESEIVGEYGYFYLKPPEDTGLYQQFVMVEGAEIADEQRILLRDSIGYTRIEGVEFDPEAWEQLALLPADLTLSELREEIGPYDYVFLFPDNDGESVDLTGGRIRVLRSPFSDVLFLWLELPRAGGTGGRLAAAADRPARILTFTTAISFPWQLIGHAIHLHFDLGIEEWFFSPSRPMEIRSLEQHQRVALVSGPPTKDEPANARLVAITREPLPTALAETSDTLIATDETDPAETPSQERPPTEAPANAPAQEAQYQVPHPLRCRGGPGTVYSTVWYLNPGEEVKVLGVAADSSWIMIEHPEDPRPSHYCWISVDTEQVAGSVESLPTVKPPPTPTPNYRATEVCQEKQALGTPCP